MKCKRGDARAASRSMLERIKHLPTEGRRKSRIGDAIGVGELVPRHMEGTEQKVEHRKGRGEILLPSPFGHGVVPAVEDGACEHVFEWAECPIQIGMYEG